MGCRARPDPRFPLRLQKTPMGLCHAVWQLEVGKVKEDKAPCKGGRLTSGCKSVWASQGWIHRPEWCFMETSGRKYCRIFSMIQNKELKMKDFYKHMQSHIRYTQTLILSATGILQRYCIPLIVKVRSGTTHILWQISVYRRHSFTKKLQLRASAVVGLCNILVQCLQSEATERKAFCSHYWVNGIALLGSPPGTVSSVSGKYLFKG